MDLQSWVGGEGGVLPVTVGPVLEGVQCRDGDDFLRERVPQVDHSL